MVRFIFPSEFHILEWDFLSLDNTASRISYIEMSTAGLLSGQTAISTVSNIQQWSKT